MKKKEGYNESKVQDAFKIWQIQLSFIITFVWTYINLSQMFSLYLFGSDLDASPEDENIYSLASFGIIGYTLEPGGFEKEYKDTYSIWRWISTDDNMSWMLWNSLGSGFVTCHVQT